MRVPLRRLWNDRDRFVAVLRRLPQVLSHHDLWPLNAIRRASGRPGGPAGDATPVLLDWAFALPPGTRVGHLVTPEEMARRRTPPSPTATPAPEGTGPAGAGSASAGYGSPWGILGALLALAASVLIVAVVRVVRLVRGRRALSGRREGRLVA